MKKLLLSFLVGLSCQIGYADTKISAMSSTTTLNAGDVIPVVANPSGAASNRIITKANLSTTLDILTGSSATATYVQISSANANFVTISSANATVSGLLSNSSATATYLNLATVLPATQFPALTGDITTSAGSLATTAAATQANIKTFTSSITVNNAASLGTATTVVSLSTNVVISTGNAATPAIGSTTGHLRISQGAGDTRAISFFNSATGNSLGYISNVFGSSFVIDNEQNAALTLGTNGVVRQTVAGNGFTTFSQGVQTNSSMTVISPTTNIYEAVFSSVATANSGIAISTNSEIVVLGSTGTSGQFLTSNGPGLPISWTTGANQSITVSGDSAGSGTTAITLTAASSQANIKTFTSSITLNSGAYIVGTSSGNILTVSSNSTGVNLLAISSTPAVNQNDFLLSISSTNGTLGFGIQNNSHVISSGTVPSVSSCGTSPSMDGNSTDFAGTINTGSASPTACTLTFAYPFANVPVCVVSDDLQTSEPAVTSRSTTAITVTLGAALNSGHLFYICVGQKG